MLSDTSDSVHSARISITAFSKQLPEAPSTRSEKPSAYINSARLGVGICALSQARRSDTGVLFSIRNLNVTAVGYVHFRSGFHAQRDSSSDIFGISNG